MNLPATPMSSLFLASGLLLLIGLLFLWLRSKNRKKAERVREEEYTQRRASKQARREARRKSRERDIQEAQQARKRGDRRPVVLVVDDSSTVIEAIRRALEDKQYRVVTARHGREAWGALQDLKPDIVVSDIEMPVLDGLGLLRQIRSDIELANLPVILMTANAKALLEAGKHNGVSGVLAKPFEDRDLIGQIRFLLQEA